jgi:hypothetical protein
MELSGLKLPFATRPPKVVFMLALVLALPPGYSPTVRAESDEAPTAEVKKCGEGVTCLSLSRRRDVPSRCCRFLQSGGSFSQSGLARRQPVPHRAGHRHNDQLLAPLLC